MMKYFPFFIFTAALTFASLPIFAQTQAQIAPGAREQLNTLLNKPSIVRPATAAPLGKNWFKLEIDAHVITDEVSFSQVASVLVDIENTATIFDGKKSKNAVTVVSREEDEVVVDFHMINIAPLGIQIKTPYRAAIRTAENTETRTYVEIRQLASDSDSNKYVKRMFASRYAEEFTLNGKTYIYIRIYAIDDVNASILPGARGALENNSDPANIEALQLIIAAAKKR